MRRAIILVLAALTVGLLVLLVVRSSARYARETMEGSSSSLDGALDPPRDFCTFGETHSHTFDDSDLTVTYPCEYDLVRSNEEGRRGTFASYDFSPSPALSAPLSPRLKEIQFFSRASLERFAEDCAENDGAPCFFGDWHTTEEYDNLLNAYRSISDFGTKHMLVFRDRNYLVNTIACEGDDCAIREYMFFIGDVMVDVWIEMENLESQEAADSLFGMLVFE